MVKEMEFLCEKCVCQPICYLYSVTGGLAICKYFITKESVRAKWKLGNYGMGTCSRCNFTQNGVWDYDHHQRFCGVCGAEMELEAGE